MVAVASHWDTNAAGQMIIGLPFIPHEKIDVGKFRWHCILLTEDGKCGDYDHRPVGPCMLYQPGQDAMCVAHHNWEGLGRHLNFVGTTVAKSFDE